MGTLVHTSASPAHQLSSMAPLVTVVRFSTAPIVLLYVESHKVRR